MARREPFPAFCLALGMVSMARERYKQMKTHTPDPWLVRYEPGEDGSELSIIRIIEGSPASLRHPQGPVVIANITYKTGDPYGGEALANADLISAAPEMLNALRACERALYLCGDDHTVDSAWAKAKAAISKAIGITRTNQEEENA